MAAEHEPQMAVYTLVVLGSEKTGKKTLIRKFDDSVYRETTDPNFAGWISKTRRLDGKEHRVEVHSPHLSASKSTLYETGQGFLLLFAVNDQQSFQHIRRLHSQIRAVNRKPGQVPIFLAASKADLQSATSIKLEEAADLARELKCQKLFEVSSKVNHQDEINDMFDKLLRETIKNDQQGKSTIVPLNTTLPRSTMPSSPIPPSPIQSPISYDGGSPTADSPRRSNVFDRLKFGTLKRKTSFQSLTRKKSGSFSESLRSFTSQYQGKDMKQITNGNGLENSSIEKPSSAPYRLDVDTSSWRETVKWPTDIIPEEALKPHR